MRSWMRYFWYNEDLVSDQESSLMTVGARVGIAWQPVGTTSKLQGRLHTSTGLGGEARGHYEADNGKRRSGIEVSGEEQASEAS